MPLLHEPQTPAERAAVKRLVERARNADPAEVGALLLKFKTHNIDKAPAERRKRVGEFIEALTPGDVKALGVYGKKMIIHPVEDFLTAPPVLVRLNAA